ncbi:hypothetical protein SAMN05216312_1244 [Cohnella sp. OV330]|uniref:hypothetical protein n=1 Tax=Cohnella sp. OV330 TaxID=1855288 RepID=UPI0008E67FF0|nr:hypothetical protein [Cohnella sp. OV330]SFB62863.1 hypothetical protein SAMN05216312_1244 [Cohnella sp. OV330]
MEIYTSRKSWVLFGLLLIGLAVLPILAHTVVGVISGITTIIGGIAFILLGLGKLSYVELNNDYLIYHYFFKKIKKWRSEEISLITRTKRWDRTTIYVYKGNENITLFSYSEKFWDHLGRIAKNAKVTNE